MFQASSLVRRSIVTSLRGFFPAKPGSALQGAANLLISLYRLCLVGHTRLTKTAKPVHSYKNHRFPVEIISHAVWLYFRFCLSSCDVEELLFARGITVTYEAIRKWCRKFGQQYAHRLHRRRPQPGDTWHVDELFLTIRGQSASRHPIHQRGIHSAHPEHTGLKSHRGGWRQHTSLQG